MKKYIKLLIFVFTIILIYSTLNAKTIGLLLTDKFESVNCTYLINMVLSDYLIIISFVLMVLVLFYIYKAIDGDPTKLPFIGGGEWTIGIYSGSNPWDL
ncbi:MAG: hypothetical protein GY865_13960, partial [candidate division Zixibacteria bacterium]|nr:hypothetical protein [candidate division Zixibacteria bacterium]